MKAKEENLKIKCKVEGCEEEFNTQRKFIYHIKSVHKMTTESYHVKYEGAKKIKCLYCDDMVVWNERTLKYNKTCSARSCVGKLANVQSKIKFKEKYGVENPGQLDDYNEKVKKTKLTKYGDATYNNIKKNKETCLERYGVDNVSKSQQIKDKISTSMKIHEK